MNKLIGILLKTPDDTGISQRMAAENFSVYKKQYLIACVFLLIIAGTTAFSAWLMGPIVRDVFYGNDFDQAICTFFKASLVATFDFANQSGESDG